MADAPAPTVVIGHSIHGGSQSSSSRTISDAQNASRAPTASTGSSRTASSAQQSSSSAASNATQPTPELSNAERKKLQKQEKADRRAKEREAAASQSPATSSQPAPDQQQRRSPQQDPRRRDNSQQRRRRNSAAATTSAVRIPLRTKVDHSAEKRVEFFSHLYGQPRKRTLEGAPKDVHPAISALALQLSSYVICGSHARGVAMLLALKAVVESYITPHGTSLPRHLASHYLTPQLTHIKSARPFSTTQANSIRWLKNLIANIDPSVPEEKAKQDICAAIDTFISERFTVADQVIADSAADHIADGDVVVIFGKSAVVQAALLNAAEKGRRFRTVVIDSRPLFEGRSSAFALSAAGLDVQYSSLTGLEHAIQGATKCFLGAHAILGNGRLYSRAGTALVAMMARLGRTETIVCAETIKFSERVALDSIVVNELAPEEELIDNQGQDPLDESKAHPEQKKSQQKGQDKSQDKGKTGSTRLSDLSGEEVRPDNSLLGWRDKDNLHLLNIMYDVTPIEYIDNIITELGSLLPSSAPAVQRLSMGA